MRALEKIYKMTHSREVPYYYKYSFFTILWKPLRKFLNVSIIPFLPFNSLRVCFYRRLGFQIGKDVFIGMRCYLDDIEPGMTKIGNNVTISYGCFFACHGINQLHTPINILDGAYIGMRATIISGTSGVVIGRDSIVGACSLVNSNVPNGTTVVGVPAKVIRLNRN